MAQIVVEISSEDFRHLALLCGNEDHYYAATVKDVVEQLARSAAAGVRRPGSWERGWLTQATGWPERLVPLP